MRLAGVNFIDTYLREGRYPAALPFVPGQEAAGVVAAVGEGVTGFARRRSCGVDRDARDVCGVCLCSGGDLLHVPEGMSLKQAAAALTQGLTAHYLAYDTYAIQRAIRCWSMRARAAWGCC